jgi:hypothetical protein
MPISRLAGLWRNLVGSGLEPDDGYGQSVFDDIGSARRLRALKRKTIIWLAPATWSGCIRTDFPILDRFGDGALCWHGWPDPPEFAIFAFDIERRIIWAVDFDHLPECWALPTTV